MASTKHEDSSRSFVPGAHSAISKAGATVLGFYFGNQFTFDVTSESLAGVTRHFTSFSAAAEEAGLKSYLRRVTLPNGPHRWQEFGQAGRRIYR